MKSWQEQLTAAFTKVTNIAILGIGNELKGDDGIGPYIIDQLKPLNHPDIELINARNVPENFLNQLIESHPQLILLIDAALMKAEPGAIQFIDKKNIGGVVVSSHSLPLTFFIEYLEDNISTTILILGVQPLSAEFLEPLSEPVQQSAKEIITTLTQLFKKTV